jgi:signal transduction histidine kinase
MFLISGIILLSYWDLVWLVNYGSKGPAIIFYVVVFCFLILLFHRKYYLAITLVVVLNLVGFYCIEHFYPDFIGNYRNSEARLTDTYTGALLSVLILLSFLAAIKRNYIQEFERAKKSDQLKSAFVANLSHEIRTPLNAIVGFSSLMSDPEIDAGFKEQFEEQILQNSDYLLHLIEDIIDVSKIESNQLTINFQDVDIVALVNQIIQTFRLNVAAGKELELVSMINVPEMVVTADRVRLEQILRNLLANAVKFTEKGKVSVDCNRGENFFIFSVSDTGIGIGEQDQLLIFNRFMKIENSRQRLYRGTGIGLFLSRQLVQMMGGKIWVESEPEKGSTFYFTIPH